MANIITDPIPSKDTPWANYSGQRVEEYIKSQFEGRAGYFYPDTDNNRVLVFADQENAELYLDDPQAHAGLLIATLAIPSEFSAKINVTVPEGGTAYVPYGSVGNEIQAELSIVNSEGDPTGDNMNVTIQIRNGTSTQKITRTIAAGVLFTMNVDEYLKEGMNIFTIGIVGQDTMAATTRSVTIYAINLQLADNFDISQVYRNDSPDAALNVQFTLSGSGTKYLEWYIDDTKLAYDANFDIVTSPSVSRIRPINIYSLNLSPGRHTLQYRAYVEIEGGTRFYSDALWRDFVVSDGYLTTDVITTALTIPSANGIIDNPATQPIPLYGVEQYIGLDMRYAVYSPRNVGQVQITFDGKTQTFGVENYLEYTYHVLPYTFGTKSLQFTVANTTLTFSASVAESSFDLEEITDNLTFSFSGQDRTNESSNRASWVYGDYIATFSGFQWTKQSGWTEEGLVIPSGASLTFNKGPLATESKTYGATFEFEYETRHVTDDDAVICDLRQNGAGILITASEASITSRGGTSVFTKFKAGEPIRVAFVINQTSGVRNLLLVFIYIDGILSGAVTYDANDSFISNAHLGFSGSSDATIVLKYMRFYGRALDMDEIVNNYVLYRPDIASLVSTYNRNDIRGLVDGQPDYDKVAAQIPTMIITGDVDRLQHFTRDDKKTYVKMEKLEYYHPTDLTKNFTLTDFSLRCQGTSSMDYPRKNFRFYLQKDAADTSVPAYTTRMFDWEGKELLAKKRVYAFKDGSQPVKTFCLKADYAESSSTHNTGIARLWNNVMKNAKLTVKSDYYRQTEYPCRTMVQQAAMDNGYDYDVRTTVDGFPIALFYRPTADAPLQLLGKYNFNNDKSTESVFGFCDVPGYDFDEIEDADGNVIDSNVQCWEVVNGDYDINQFVDMSGWDNGRKNGGWEDSFESRYPDDAESTAESDRAQTALKDVCFWINSTKGASKVQNGKMVVDNVTKMNKFKTEKWQHLDVYKVAAYYVFLMRFGAVDQTVKNAMFTCEDCHSDNPHWFYINYDNDTINGLSNAGDLRFGYTIDRQTNDGGVASYAYAGHASVLWNNLEADDEFMEIVAEVDQALYEAGLTYPNVINTFNNLQSAQWSERFHNYDYNFKYIGVWLDKIDSYDQLAKLQGARRTHREWWLSNRFAIYDAKNRTGQYKVSSFNFKPQTGEYTPGEYIAITPAVDGQIFGYRVGSQGTEVVEQGEKDVPIEFMVPKNYYVGESHFFQNMVYAKSIDLSNMSHHIEEVNLANIDSDIFDSNITEIIVSTQASQTNTVMTTINGYEKAIYLERFVMCNVTSSHMGSNSLDFSGNGYLKYLDMRGSTYLTGITLPDAAPMTEIHLPSSLQTLEMRNLNLLETFDVQGNGANIKTIRVYNTPLFSSSATWFLNWFTHKTTASDECEVYIDNVAWENVTVQQMLDIAAIGDGLILKGQVLVSDLTTMAQAQALMEAYGPNCFTSTNDLWIRSLSSLSFLTMYVDGVETTEVDEGKTAQCVFAVITPYPGTITYEIPAVTRAGTSIDAASGILTTTLNDDASASFNVTAIYTFDDTTKTPETMSLRITVKRRTYPSSSDVSIVGPAAISDDTVYQAVVDGTFTGETTHSWALTGDITSYFRIGSHTKNTCVIEKIAGGFGVEEGTLTYKLYKTISGTTTTVCTVTKSITAKSDDIAVLRSENGPIMDAFWNAYGTNGTIQAGVLSNSNYISKQEARAFSGTMLNPSGGQSTSIFYAQRNNITHFEEFQYFTNVDTIPTGCFYGCVNLLSLTFPPNLIAIGNAAFYQCNAFKDKDCLIPDTVTSIGSAAFRNCPMDRFYYYGSASFNWLPSAREIYVPNIVTWDTQGYSGVTELISMPKCTKFDPSYLNTPNNDLLLIVGSVNVFNTGRNYQFEQLSKICVTVRLSATGVIGGDFDCGVRNGGENKIKRFEVETGNQYVDAIDGCWVNKSTRALIAHPNRSNVSIPQGCTEIGRKAFYGDTLVTSVEIPNTVTSIGAMAFYGAGLASVVLSANTTSYGAQCFQSCRFTTLPAIPTTLMQLVSNMFRACPFTTVMVPNHITELADSVFYQCPNLTEVHIPAGVTYVGNNCFSETPLLSAFYSQATTAPSGAGNPFNGAGASASSKNLYVPTNATGYSSGIWAKLIANGFELNQVL